jgi:hypothetical protein
MLKTPETFRRLVLQIKLYIPVSLPMNPILRILQQMLDVRLRLSELNITAEDGNSTAFRNARKPATSHEAYSRNPN